MMTESDRAWVISSALFGGAVVVAASAWAGAAAGAALTGATVHAPTPLTVYRMATDWSGTWPHSLSTVLAVLLAVLVLTAATVAVRQIRRRFAQPLDLATLSQVRDLTPTPAARTAVRLRPALKGSSPASLPPADRGVLLGDHMPSGVELRGSDEDTYVALMAPRAGKSTALSVPIAEEAPAALLMTSVKPDVYASTVASRGRRGSTWVLDTQGVAQTERAMWWDMVAQAETIEGAERLASHFVGQITMEGSAADPFWSQAAGDVLTGLYRAAYLEGATARDVMRWLADPAEKAPMHILYSHEPELAEQVESSVNIAPETRDGIYQNARTAMSALRDPKVLAWVTPDKHLPQFVPEDFVLSRDTLYLLSKKGGPASAVIAACADALFTAGAEAGERHGGRLPEPMRAVLDEAANICKIADLPDLYSHLGSRGITPYVILQSYRQGVKAWGEIGMDALWGAATKKVIGAGLDDPKFVQDVSTLIGRHDVVRPSHTDQRGQHGGGSSVSYSTQRESKLEPSEIRGLRKGTGLLLATGMPVAQIQLRPWYEEDSMDHIGPALAEEEAAITKRAVGAYELRKAARRGR